jgi:hypothetical protein
MIRRRERNPVESKKKKGGSKSKHAKKFTKKKPKSGMGRKSMVGGKKPAGRKRR